MTPLTLSEVIQTFECVRQRHVGNIPLWLAVPDAQGKVTLVPLMDMRLIVGPDHLVKIVLQAGPAHHLALVCYGPQPVLPPYSPPVS